MSLDDLAQEDRLAFIRKVCGILSIQLSFTAGSIAVVKTNSALDEWFGRQAILALSFFFVSFFVQISILCCRSVARKVPANYILLSIFTMCQAFFFCFASAQYTA